MAGHLRLMRRMGLLISALVIAALIGALATNYFTQRASSQTSTATIRACINYYNGGIRILLRASDACGQYEHMISWNQQGIQGPKGEKGEKGDQGEQGPPGPPTYLETYMVSERINLSGESGEGGEGGEGRSMAQVYSGPFMASCAPGDSLLAGGYELIADSDMLTPPLVLTNRPFVDTSGGGGGDGDGDGEEPAEPIESWIVSVQHDGLSGLDVWAICNASIIPE